ncbi:hypothetical protein [Streptomyces sp. NPDC097981]|uniref:hypothetical protein n=1 Tax=Streptomyces sp. NPDC097981 TaxID=3155428 RepID=UPI00332573F2
MASPQSADDADSIPESEPEARLSGRSLMRLGVLPLGAAALPPPVLALFSAVAARLLFPGQMLLVAFALFTTGLLAHYFTTGRRPSRA